LKNSYIAVTGAAGALGAAVCSTLRLRGHSIIGIDLAREIPGSHDYVLAIPGVDLTSDAEASQAFAQIRASFGSLAALINVAGGFAWETIEQGHIETWDRLFKMNVSTALNATKAALPLLLTHGGCIVNIGAASAVKAASGVGAYAAAKSAVARLTESLAAELLDRGVRVNAVLPSILDTPANRAAMPGDAVDRWVTTEALAEVIAFLISDSARAVTGALVPVTGRS
jgi:NAD(P)-dependent dehydrogenase (short-subunit alcohol dehydrogenase family)